MHILVIEDEVHLAESLLHILRQHGHEAEAVYDGETGLEYAKSPIYDVIILDIMLPKLDGLAVLSALRRAGVLTPVLLLTAKDHSRDKVTGLDYGADDYMTKPFDADELLARLRALSRRSVEQADANILCCEDLTLNLSNYEIACSGKRMRLTQKEGALLALLLRRKSSIVNKEYILQKVWGVHSSAEYNHVEVYISFLRKKLLRLQAQVEIKTIRGFGYRIVPLAQAGVGEQGEP